MLITRTHRLRPARRGVILLVVLALLTLFAIVGISFVLVANSQETTARIAREAESQIAPNFDPEEALNLYLGQLIYGASDDSTGVNSSIRGHDLARLMYGFNVGQPNDKAYCGTGRLHNATGLGGIGTMGDEAFLVNYQYFPNDNLGYRAPERPGFQPTLAAAASAPYTGGANVPYTYPDHQNFSLAYQDATSGMILVPSFHREYLFGRLDQSTNTNWTNQVGKYLTARPRPIDVDPTGSGGFPYPADRGGDVKNLDWAPGGNDSIWTDPGFPVMTNVDGRKYKILVAPLIMELDSRLNLNVVGNMIGNTSPNKTTNPRAVGSNSYHVSNHGLGPWEINPSTFLSAGNGECKNLFYGTSPTAYSPGPHCVGRYGLTRLPGLGIVMTGYNPLVARGWAAVDRNGIDETTGGQSTTPYLLPGAGTNLQYNGQAYNPQYANQPFFPANCYGTGTFPATSLNEGLDNPLDYNPWRLAAGLQPGANRKLPIHAMHQILRYGSTGGDYITSDLLRLLPTNLSTDAGAAKRRNLITLVSAHLDRPGVTPYIWDPTNGPPYIMPVPATGVNPQPANWPPTVTGQSAPLMYPQCSPIPFPPLASRSGAVPSGSEFDQASWRSTLSQLGKLNLNRVLTPFPVPNATGVDPDTNHVQGYQALADRQAFASDIFNRLCAVTGALSPSAAYVLPPANGLPPGNGQSQQYLALRYLAQLAANIVDYIDTDDQSTPYNWYNPPGGKPEWVFGTETPRLLINEGYAQYDNTVTYGTPPNTTTDPLKNGAGTYVAQNPYAVNVWIELFNPLLVDPVSSSTADTTARLQVNAATGTNNGPSNLYRVLLVNNGATNAQTTLTNPANTIGDPDFGTTNPGPGNTNIYNWPNGQTLPGVIDFGAAANPANATTTIVQPMPAPAQYPPQGNGVANTGAAQGFYVLGSNFTFLTGTNPGPAGGTYAANPTLPYSFLSPNMSYIPPSTTTPTIPANSAATSPATVGALTPPLVLLQRLACPLLPYNNTATSSTYNPYITVDSFLFSTVNDARYFNTTGTNNPIPVNKRIAYGRQQPFGNNTTQIHSQVYSGPAIPTGNPPANTFFSHNSTLTTPFSWNTHLDRQLISPVELLFVHGARPMDLTAQFVDNNGNLNQARYAPWLDQASRLHRFLEMVETGPLSNGVQPGGRIPGLLNINGIWEPEIFNALCDAQLVNYFNQANVSTLFSYMKSQRSPNTGTFSGATMSFPGPTDQMLVAAANNGGFGTAGLGSGAWQLDRPFWGHATGWANNTSDPMAQSESLNGNATVRGLDNTLLRALTPGAMPSGAANTWMPDRVFTVPPPAVTTPPAITHPYQRNELLSKIYNNVTTRSNVFAVYLTVGFFTVTNDATTPVQLGAEVGRLENRQVRHRMFAIVDRSNLQAFQTTCYGITVTSATPNPPYVGVQNAQNPRSNNVYATVLPLNIASAGTNGALVNPTWTVQPGMYLTYEPNTDNEETVMVIGVNGVSTNTALFQRSHPSGSTVINRGNPGPWLRYNPRLDGGVVPYFAIID